MRYAFKDRYTDYQGTDVERAFNTRFYAYAGTGTAATRQNPTRSNGTIAATSGQNQSIILGGGYHKFSVGTTSAPVNGNNRALRIIGHGMKNSIVDTVIYEGAANETSEGVYFKDITVKNVTIYRLGNTVGNYYNRYYLCEMLALPNQTNLTGGLINYYNNCIFRVDPSAGTVYNNNSFIGAVISTIPTTHQQLFENCDIYLPDATLLDNRVHYFFAFDRCRFRIIGETGYTELTGSTPEELRVNFVARCVAQGYNPPDNTEFGETLKFYRWVFTKNSCFESNIPAGSDIHNFEKPRSISFGAISARVGRVPVAVSPTTPSTINAGAPTSGNMSFREDGLRILEGIDISGKHSFTAESNIVWLGGKKKLSYLDIIDNFQKAYGLQADSTPDLLLDNGILPGGTIEPGKFYILRSTDKQAATAVYNGTTYSTSLSARNNLIYGVSGATTYTAGTGNPILYEVWDELQYRTIQIRIVNKIPSDIIRPANALLEGYWYFVEHDTDQSNTTDYVTWQGRNYPVLSSFYIFPGLATSFTVSGNVHLRRCWQEDFDLNRSVDRAFWENEQKPKWVHVTEKDVRCLLKNNNELSVEMQTGADGNYIASGHPEFYKAITGETGILLKPMPIKGTYMQIRIVASTLNTM